MNTRDSEFLELYKRLDLKFQKYTADKNGISAYIESRWEDYRDGSLSANELKAFKSLKHLRYIRNKIAHETSAEGFSTDGDIAEIKSLDRNFFKTSGGKAVSGKSRAPGGAARKTSEKSRDDGEINPIAVTLFLFSAAALIFALCYFLSSVW